MQAAKKETNSAREAAVSPCGQPASLPRILAVGNEMSTLISEAAAHLPAPCYRADSVQTAAEALRELLNYPHAVVLVSASLPDLNPGILLEDLHQLAPRAAILTTAPLPMSLRAATGRHIQLKPPLDPAALHKTILRLIAENAASTPNLFDAIIHSLNHVEDVIVDTSRTQDALGSVCLELASLARSNAVALYLPGTSEPCFILASSLPLQAGHISQLTLAVEQGFARFTHMPAQFPEPPQLVVAPDAPELELPPFSGIICVPLLSEHQIKGVLCAAFTTAEAQAGCSASTLFHLANHSVLIYQEVWRARNMAARDLLTGLYNRSMFTESLRQTFSLAQRKGAPIGLLLFDFDNLKSINDQYGHLAGDKVLHEAANLTLATARASDIVARFGGDEFVVILPDTTLPDAQRVAERLLAAFREREFGGTSYRLHVTISIGVAVMKPTQESSSQTLIAQADERLLAAKHSGKDRICAVASSDGAPAATTPAPASTAATAQRGRILILDDEPTIRLTLSGMLNMMKFDVVACATLEEALLAIEKQTPDFDLVLTDLHLGNGTGIDLLQALKDKAPWTVKMVVSAYASKETAIECLRHGAFDFIEKPFAYTQLATAMSRAMEHRRLLIANQRYQNQLEDLVRSRSESLAHALETLRRSYAQTIQTMALMIDARDGNTGLHCRAAREAVRLLARQMRISHHDIETIEMGAELHDIGKLGIPDAILQKPGPLTPEELVIMRTHPQIGYDLLAGVPFLHDVAEIARQHHEAFDGSGYPAGLKGDQICVGARVFAIIDAYHAMRSTRCYRPPMSEEAACNEIIRCAGRQFDPVVVTAFLTCRKEIEATFASMRRGDPA